MYVRSCDSLTFTTGSFGARAPAASVFAVRSMPESSSLRTSGLKVRKVICSFTSSGTMLYFVPPWMEPTVRTAGSSGSFSRETSVCQASTVRAAMKLA